MTHIQSIAFKYMKSMGITDDKAIQQTLQYLKPQPEYPSLELLIGTYLRLLGHKENGIVENMQSFLEAHPKYPNVESLAECFSTWNFPITVIQPDEERLKKMQGFFLAKVEEQYGNWILVLKLDSAGATYLNVFGNVVNKNYEDFISTIKFILTVEITQESGSINNGQSEIKGNGFEKSKKEYPSLLDILKVAIDRHEAVTYRLFRGLSIFFTYVFIRLNIKPVLITMLWLGCVLGASLTLFLRIDLTGRLIAASLIFLHYILDCSDGEVARITKRTSKFGSILEQLVHWTGMFTLVVGITLGLYRAEGNPNILILGLFCLLFDALFHFILYYSHYWYNPKRKYGRLIKISNSLNWVLPINPNLFFWCILFNSLHFSLISWTISAPILIVLLASPYLLGEYRFLKSEVFYNGISIIKSDQSVIEKDLPKVNELSSI